MAARKFPSGRPKNSTVTLATLAPTSLPSSSGLTRGSKHKHANAPIMGTKSTSLPTKSIPYVKLHPRPPKPCLQSSRFHRRSVSRDVRGQVGAGAFVRPVTCGKGEGGETHGRRATSSLSSLPPAAMPGSVEPSKHQRKPMCSEARRSPVGTGSPERTPKATRVRSHRLKNKVRFRTRVGSPGFYECVEVHAR